MKKVLIVVGTRPNFIKVTRFKSLVAEHTGLECKILHTGQHADEVMSEVFFREFELQVDYRVTLNPSSTVTQMAQIMQGIEKNLMEYQPHAVIVPGDVNSTLAGALVAHKMGVFLAHLESGLRSFDRSMPEEINRILTDEISDLFFVTEESGVRNLKNERKSASAIHLVGNTMIDTLVHFDKKIRQSNVLSKLGLSGQYALITLHRPSNVDSEMGLRDMSAKLGLLAQKLPVVFPIHPRTAKRIKEFGLETCFYNQKNIVLCEPQAYFDFQHLILHSTMVLTDSGGIQEETTFRQVPCITLRTNTERPVTCEEGTNTLVGNDTLAMIREVENILAGKYKKGKIPTAWDGKSTERIIEILKNVL